MKQDVIQLNIESERDSFLKKLYSPLGELSRAEYFRCAFFLFIPCKILVFLIKFFLIALVVPSEFIYSEVMLKMPYLATEIVIDVLTFTYPCFIIVIKRLRFVGYKSKINMFIVLIIILMQDTISVLELDWKILMAIYFVPPSILLFKIHGK